MAAKDRSAQLTRIGLALSLPLLLLVACENFGFPAGGKDYPPETYPPGPLKESTGLCPYSDGQFIEYKDLPASSTLGHYAPGKATGPGANCGEVPAIGGFRLIAELGTRPYTASITSRAPLYLWVIETESDRCLEQPLACAGPLPDSELGLGGAAQEEYTTVLNFDYKRYATDCPHELHFLIGSLEADIDPETIVTFSFEAVEAD